MRFSCIVSQANGNLTVLPMEIAAGNTFSATIPADLAIAGTTLWIRDESGTTDTNGGNPWTITK